MVDLRCDNPDILRAKNRVGIGDHSFWDVATEGMCSSVWCNFTDVNAWRDEAQHEMDLLKRIRDQLEEMTRKKYGSLAGAPPELYIQSKVDVANEILSDWKRSWENWSESAGDYTYMVGGPVIVHGRAKEYVMDIIRRFRDASCHYDEMARGVDALGGYVPEIEEEKRKELEEKDKPKRDPWKTGMIVGALGLAAFFTYKTTRQELGR